MLRPIHVKHTLHALIKVKRASHTHFGHVAEAFGKLYLVKSERVYSVHWRAKNMQQTRPKRIKVLNLFVTYKIHVRDKPSF